MRRDFGSRYMRDQADQDVEAVAAKEQSMVRDDRAVDKTWKNLARDGAAR